MVSTKSAFRFSIAIVLSVGIVRSGQGSEHDPEAVAKFKDGIQQSKQDKEAVSFRAHVDYEYSSRSGGFKFDIAANGIAHALHKDVSESSEVLHVRNDTYAFRVERPLESDSYSLSFLVPLEGGVSSDPRIEEFEMMFQPFAESGMYLWTDSLSELISEDRLKVDKAYFSGTDSRIVVEFHYSSINDEGSVETEISEGKLVCDPAKGFLLDEYQGKRYSVENDFTRFTKTSIVYGNQVDGRPFATAITQETLTETGETKSKGTTQVELTEAFVPKEEFFLSFYGLPEPNFQKDSAWFWIVLIGLTASIFGVLLLRRHRSAQ